MLSPLEQAQLPVTHMAPREHAVPQAPQFPGSESRSTQAPAQAVSPVEHCEAQTPWEQTVPAAQTSPHAPQLAGSCERTAHASPQRVDPGPHVGPPPPLPVLVPAETTPARSVCQQPITRQQATSVATAARNCASARHFRGRATLTAAPR
jgi:hypothetical protein